MRENKTSNRIFSGVMCRVCVVMLMVTFISCHAVSGTVAKYVTSKTSDSDSARVASFSVEALGNDSNENSLALKYGTSDKSKAYKITVNNNSEVVVSYSVSIVFPSDVTNYLRASLDGSQTNGVFSDDKTVFTWVVAPLEIGGSKELTLTLTAAGEGIYPSEDEKVSVKEESFSFATNVEFVQVD